MTTLNIRTTLPLLILSPTNEFIYNTTQIHFKLTLDKMKNTYTTRLTKKFVLGITHPLGLRIMKSLPSENPYPPSTLAYPNLKHMLDCQRLSLQLHPLSLCPQPL